MRTGTRGGGGGLEECEGRGDGQVTSERGAVWCMAWFRLSGTGYRANEAKRQSQVKRERESERCADRARHGRKRVTVCVAS